MKKFFLSALLSAVLLVVSTTSVSAQNKAGINIGDHWDQFDQAAEVVGPGGWIVVIACPGDGDKIAERIANHPEINLVIRGHYPKTNPTKDLAKAWVATLGTLPSPNKIYFMPWNEPNQFGSDDWGEPREVIDYTNFLAQQLEAANLKGKVFLLSPMLNYTFMVRQDDPRKRGNFDSYLREIRGIQDNYFSLFDGIALNLYDHCFPSPVLSCDSKYQNPLKVQEILNDMGASGKPVFGVEAGTAGGNFYWKTPPTSSSPLYQFVNRFKDETSARMFAIPAYDLASEVGQTWSLFSPPDVANLLRNMPKGETTPSSSVSFSSPLPKCPGKNYAFYVTGQSECNECGSGGEPMILAVKDNLICTDFSLNKGSETSQYAPATPPPGQQSRVLAAGNGESAEGSLTLQKEAVPNFSLMEQNLYLGLNRLLPQALRQNLNLDSTPLKTKLKHYVVDKENPKSPTEIPETKVTLPSWWTRLLGLTKIACGLFNTCEPPKKMNIKIAANVPEPPGWEVGCPTGDLAENSPVNQLESSPDSTFSTPASFITTVVKRVLELIESFWKWLTTTRTDVNLVNKSRGGLPGGATFNEQSTYLKYAIPQALSPDNEDAPLASEAKFEVGGGYKVGESSDKLNYQEEATRQRYCLERCALRPQGIPIQTFDPLCPTCSF